MRGTWLTLRQGHATQFCQRPDSRGYPGHASCNPFASAMNEEETADLVLFEQPVIDADDLVEAEVEDLDDDYQPSEEVILLDLIRLDDDDVVVIA